MLTLSAELSRRYEALLRQQGVASQHGSHYAKWLRYYWDFCHKYGFEPNEWSLGSRTRHCLPQWFDMPHQQFGPALKEIDGEKVSASRHTVTAVIRHR